MKRFILLIPVLFCALLSVTAQSGDISGKVSDEKGEGIPFANVSILEDGVPTGQGTTTDFDGNYSLKPLNPGKYDVKFSYVGYTPQVQTGIVVSVDKSTYVSPKLATQDKVIEEVQIIVYKVPLIDPGATSTQNTLTAEEISVLPTKGINSIASSTAGVYQGDEGDGVNVRGGRSDATEYYINGIKVRGNVQLPSTSIEQMTVVTGGVPSKYGDATGGIINITTRGPSRNFAGGVEVVTSQFLDGFGYNLVNFNLTGPILKRKNTNRTMLGFFIAGEYSRQVDADPSAIGIWKVKDDVLAELEQNPLTPNPNNESFLLSSEYITANDLEKIKAKQNTVESNYRLSANFDFKPTDNVNVSIGGDAVYRQYNDWIERYTLFNNENNPLYTEQTYRGFARFTQNLGTKQTAEDAEEGSSSAFQNAYYTIQLDYEKTKQKFEDEDHGDNFFNYGYIGEFDAQTAPVYSYQTHDITDANGDVTQSLTGWKLIAYQDTLVNFTPGMVNPKATRYTEQYYELVGTDRSAGFNENIFDIQGNNALINGQRSAETHGVWFNTGRQFNGYRTRDNDQYRMQVSGAFDILKPGASTRNKHSIEFGFEFEQRIDRSWQVSPLLLWDIMRLRANNHLNELDVDANNPTLLIDGVEYEFNDPTRPDFGPNDTILTDRINNSANQSFFDKQLRQTLGLDVNGTDIVNIDALDPSMYSLGMFSADELLNEGSQIVFYNGYNVRGKKYLGGQPSFNDFFTKKDENGNATRDIPAFSPIYTAAYIQDKFQFKDLTFNIGVRIDRFDANQKVLRDPYSLYQIRTASEVTHPDGTHPGNIGDDFFVYADDADNPGSITGYRDGDQWYDADGNQLTNAAIVAGSSVSGGIEPWLVDPTQDIKDVDNFNPDQTFKDYDPQITVMPRLQFSFNLTDRALFFAHYDILSQRPQTGGVFGNDRSQATPDQWLFFTDNIGGFLDNPDLKPEKTIDFQLGFRQKVSNSSAITISAFYRELKDMVQTTKFYYAYPLDYNTFGNEDFGTAKGFSIDYDLRRTGNIRMKANYSIQFAEGTGSSATSNFSLVNANQPNLRTIYPLNFDARHTINVTMDYRYGSGSDYNGPTIKDKQIFSNAGINLTLVARSGTPYTQQQNATPEAIRTAASRPITEGSLNGSRLPWSFRVNTKINKQFSVKLKDKEDGKKGKSLNFNVYVQIQNLLNADNVVNVYRYTGNANDDGYLADPQGVQSVDEKVTNGTDQSYVDLYNAYVDRPTNYSRPRTIRLGAEISF